MSAIESLVSVPEDVVIGYMHQVLLGVVKKTVNNIDPERNFSAQQKGLGCRRLTLCRLPSQEYNRQLRPLDTLKLWKASELKLFLLYGFLFFLGTISDQMFIHFWSIGVLEFMSYKILNRRRRLILLGKVWTLFNGRNVQCA